MLHVLSVWVRSTARNQGNGTERLWHGIRLAEWSGAERLRYEMYSAKGTKRLRYWIDSLNGAEFLSRYGINSVNGTELIRSTVRKSINSTAWYGTVRYGTERYGTVAVWCLYMGLSSLHNRQSRVCRCRVYLWSLLSREGWTFERCRRERDRSWILSKLRWRDGKSM